MNVNDVKFEKPKGDMLIAIFDQQKSLMDKYHHIEEKSGVGYGLLQGEPFDINGIRSQELVKNFAWRVTEEITEAFECHPITEREHQVEEMADALHFLTELCITVDITPVDILNGTYLNNSFIPVTSEEDFLIELFKHETPSNRNPSPNPFSIIMDLGLACNCLKQKPWKQTHVLTDKNKFLGYINQSFRTFIHLCITMNIDYRILYNYYFRKNKVNQFRQESNY